MTWNGTERRRERGNVFVTWTGRERLREKWSVFATSKISLSFLDHVLRIDSLGYGVL